MSEEAHAKLSASGSGTWINCPGSIKKSEGQPNESSGFAREGTAAHELANMCLEQGKMAIDFYKHLIVVEGESIEVDAEMVDNVQFYLDYCNALPGQHSWVETRVQYTNWVPAGFGTSDFIKVDVDPDHGYKTIHVADLKYGKGVQVSAMWNSQAMIYGLGVLQTFGLYYDFHDDDIVNCVVVQPRISREPSEFKILVKDLLHWAKTVVAPRAKQALSGSGFVKPGEKQCKWCLSKPFCGELAHENLAAASDGFKAISDPLQLKEKKDLTNAEIGIIMEQIPMIKDWAKGVEAYAFNQLDSGAEVPGYKLVIGKAGNKKWKYGNDAILKHILEVGLPGEEVSELITEKIATPTQVEKLLKLRKIDRGEIENLWTQAEGNPTIVKASDKKKAIQPSVNEGFKAITNEPVE